MRLHGTSPLAHAMNFCLLHKLLFKKRGKPNGSSNCQDTLAPNSRKYDIGLHLVKGFQELLWRGVSKDVEDRYQYMLGASHYNLRQFGLAAAPLRRVVNWKGSEMKADASFVLGQVYRQFGASRQARSMFEAVLKESPSIDRAAAARQELKELASNK